MTPFTFFCDLYLSAPMLIIYALLAIACAANWWGASAQGGKQQ